MSTNQQNRLWGEAGETVAARTEQARQLKEMAQKGGLRFEAYLPPDLAIWVLDQMERVDFVDPSELVFTVLQQAGDIDADEFLQSQILRARIEQGMSDGRDKKTCSWEDVEKRIAARRETIGEPAYWTRIDNRGPDSAD